MLKKSIQIIENYPVHKGIGRDFKDLIKRVGDKVYALCYRLDYPIRGYDLNFKSINLNISQISINRDNFTSGYKFSNLISIPILDYEITNLEKFLARLTKLSQKTFLGLQFGVDREGKYLHLFNEGFNNRLKNIRLLECENIIKSGKIINELMDEGNNNQLSENAGILRELIGITTSLFIELRSNNMSLHNETMNSKLKLEKKTTMISGIINSIDDKYLIIESSENPNIYRILEVNHGWEILKIQNILDVSNVQRTHIISSNYKHIIY